MINPLFLALLSAASVAVIRVLIRKVMRNDEDPLTVCIVYNLGAGLILIPLFGLPSFTGLTLSSTILLLISGTVWAVAGYCDTRSFIDLDASVNALFSAFRYVILVVGSLLFFAEPFKDLTLLGVLLIALSMLLTSNFRSATFRRGALFRFIAIIFINVGILIDKYLTTSLPVAIVVLSAFFLPGFFLASSAPSKVLRIPSLLQRVGFPLLFIMPLQATVYGGYVYAFSSGSLIEASTVLHSSIFFTFIVEVLFERKHENLMRRAIAALGCTVGVLLVTLF